MLLGLPPGVAFALRNFFHFHRARAHTRIPQHLLFIPQVQQQTHRVLAGARRTPQVGDRGQLGVDQQVWAIRSDAAYQADAVKIRSKIGRLVEKVCSTFGLT